MDQPHQAYPRIFAQARKRGCSIHWPTPPGCSTGGLGPGQHRPGRPSRRALLARSLCLCDCGEATSRVRRTRATVSAVHVERVQEPAHAGTTHAGGQPSQVVVADGQVWIYGRRGCNPVPDPAQNT
jgi:hypothetical protein